MASTSGLAFVTSPFPLLPGGSGACLHPRTSVSLRTSRRARRSTLRIHTTCSSSSSSPPPPPPPPSRKPTSEAESLKDVFETSASDSTIPVPSSSSSSSSSSSGFALSDLRQHTFSSLSEDATPFERGGAYAIFNASDEVVYMGYSKNIASKLSFHASLQPQSCSCFRAYIPPVPPELISPDLLESVLEYWVRELGDVPRGNAVDRALWENANPVDKQSSAKHSIPTRDRTTAPRAAPQARAPRSYSSDPFADAFRSSAPPSQTSSSSSSSASTRSASDPAGWHASEEDFVRVNVDPFDPFSASNREPSTRSSWTDVQDDSNDEDWYPLLLIMGGAGLLWLIGLLSNALPAATPSLGM